MSCLAISHQHGYIVFSFGQYSYCFIDFYVNEMLIQEYIIYFQI